MASRTEGLLIRKRDRKREGTAGGIKYALEEVMKRRGTVDGPGVDVGVEVEEDLHRGELTTASGRMERSPPVEVRGIDL